MKVFSFGEQSINELDHALVQMPIRYGKDPSFAKTDPVFFWKWFQTNGENKSVSVSPQPGFVVILYLIEGLIEIISTEGSRSIVSSGDIYVIRPVAGAGVHEFNFKDRAVGFALWISTTQTIQNENALNYFEAMNFSHEAKSGTGIRKVSSNDLAVGENTFDFYHILLSKKRYVLELNQGEKAFVFIISGPVLVDGVEIQPRSFVNINLSSKRYVMEGMNEDCSIAVVQITKQ